MMQSINQQLFYQHFVRNKHNIKLLKIIFFFDISFTLIKFYKSDRLSNTRNIIALYPETPKIKIDLFVEHVLFDVI